MYNETEREKLSNATKLLLKRCIQDINANNDKTTSVLLRLNNFVRIVFNDRKRVGTLCVLITTGMWSMFDKEIVK